MALSIRDYTIIKVVQATTVMSDTVHQGVFNAHVSLVSVSWILFRSPGLWEKFDLDCILGKEDQLSSLGNLDILQ